MINIRDVIVEKTPIYKEYWESFIKNLLKGSPFTYKLQACYTSKSHETLTVSFFDSDLKSSKPVFFELLDLSSGDFHFNDRVLFSFPSDYKSFKTLPHKYIKKLRGGHESYEVKVSDLTTISVSDKKLSPPLSGSSNPSFNKDEELEKETVKFDFAKEKENTMSYNSPTPEGIRKNILSQSMASVTVEEFLEILKYYTEFIKHSSNTDTL